MKKTLLSGVKPTGTVHLGNYFGAMRQFVDRQDDFRQFIFIANYHALTSVSDGELLKKLTLELAMDYLAIGIDPKKTTLFLQSDVPEVTELAWIFNTLTTVPYLMRAHAFKDAVNKGLENKISASGYSKEKISFLNDHKKLHVIELVELLPDRKSENLESINDIERLREKYQLSGQDIISLIIDLITINETTIVNAGLFDYPILMAADILVYNADVVPVGLDQKQHIEIARDTAQKFNNAFGETFKMPEPIILTEVQTVVGTDGRKMSKSYNNTIPLFGTDEEIKKAVMSIPTDSKGVEEPKDPATCKVFALHELFPGEELETLRARYLKGGIGYKESKDLLVEKIIKFISPMRARREEIARDPEAVLVILREGGEVARAQAQKMMSEVRAKVGLTLK